MVLLRYTPMLLTIYYAHIVLALLFMSTWWLALLFTVVVTIPQIVQFIMASIYHYARQGLETTLG